MDTLEQMTERAKAAVACIDKKEVVFRLTPDQKDRIDAFKKAGFIRQADAEEDAARAAHVDAVCGLQRCSLIDAAKMMGYKRVRGGNVSRSDEYRNMACPYNWGFGRRIGRAVIRAGILRRPVLRSGPAESLAVPPPYGVALLMNELAETKLFNYFDILAPHKAFAKDPIVIDPVVTAVVLSKDERRMLARYFVAKW